MIQIVEAVIAGDGRQMLRVNLPRIAARVVLQHPYIVVAGDEQFDAIHRVEKGQAALEIVPRADVAGEDEVCRRVVAKARGQQFGGPIPVRVACAVVEIGCEGDA